MTKTEAQEIAKIFRGLLEGSTKVAEQGVIDLVAGRYRMLRGRLADCDEDNAQILGEERWKALKTELDLEPAPQRRGPGRPPKEKDLPGQGDMFANQAADDARAAEDARRQTQQLDSSLQLDLEILRAMRESKHFLGTQAIASKLRIQPADVAIRLAELEQQGKIRQEGGLWQVVRGEQPSSHGEQATAKVEADELAMRRDERMQTYADEVRDMLKDGPFSQDQLVKVLAQRTGQAQSRVKDDVLPWLEKEGVIVKTSARPLHWGLPSPEATQAEQQTLEEAPL